MEADAVFESIFRHSYTIGEMEKLYAELEPEFSGKSRVEARNSGLVMRIKSYSMTDKSWNAYEYWRNNGGYTPGY